MNYNMNEMILDTQAASAGSEGMGKALWSFLVRLGRMAVCFLAVTLLFTQILAPVVTPTCSMAPTVQPGFFSLACRVGVHNQLERGTIISFQSEELNEILGKRIIGLPGERISFQDGKVLVNGQLLEEPYLPENTVTTCREAVPAGPGIIDPLSDGFFTVPENCYFVMGDNRENSWDSRYWIDPYVSFDSVVCYELFHISIPGISDMIAHNAYNTGVTIQSHISAGESRVEAFWNTAKENYGFWPAVAVLMVFMAVSIVGVIGYWEELRTARSMKEVLEKEDAVNALLYVAVFVLSLSALRKAFLLFLGI